MFQCAMGESCRTRITSFIVFVSLSFVRSMQDLKLHDGLQMSGHCIHFSHEFMTIDFQSCILLICTLGTVTCSTSSNKSTGGISSAAISSDCSTSLSSLLESLPESWAIHGYADPRAFLSVDIDSESGRLRHRHHRHCQTVSWAMEY